MLRCNIHRWWSAGRRVQIFDSKDAVYPGHTGHRSHASLGPLIWGFTGLIRFGSKMTKDFRHRRASIQCANRYRYRYIYMSLCKLCMYSLEQVLRKAGVQWVCSPSCSERNILILQNPVASQGWDSSNGNAMGQNPGPLGEQMEPFGCSSQKESAKNG